MEAEVMASAPQAPPQRGRSRGAHRVLVIALAVGLVVSIVLSAGVGAIHVPVRDVARALFAHAALQPEESTILFAIRLPRILAAAIVGSALSASGLLFQGLFRNPLADPYVIGSSGGAVLGASIGVFVAPALSFAGFSATALLAFAGAVVSIAVVYSLARVNGRTPVVTLLLAGFAVSTMLSYSSYFLEVLDQNLGTGMRVLAAWLHGAISVPAWTQLVVVFGILMIGLGASVPLMRSLNSLALGEEFAQHLGVHVEWTRVGVILVGSLLTAAAVALGGLISFVGLVVPHLARMIIGPDHARLLPVVAIGGAIFMVVTDTLARTVLAPAEVPVGVLMAFIGGPFFLFLLRQTKQEVVL